MEDRRKRPSAVMRKQAGYVFKQQIARLPGFSQSGQLEEESAAGISEPSSVAGKAESLARKSSAEQFKVGHCFGIGFSGIVNEPLSLRVKQGAVTAVGVFVDLTVSHANKIAGSGQPLPEAAHAGEHINIVNGLAHPPPSR